MSTWEMVKFWFIRETMPLWIALAVIALLVAGCFVWAGVDTLRRKFRKQPNAWVEPRRDSDVGSDPLLGGS